MSTYRNELILAAEAHMHDLSRKILELESEFERVKMLILTYKTADNDSDIMKTNECVRVYKKIINKALSRQKKEIGEKYGFDRDGKDLKYRSNKDVLQDLRDSYEKSLKRHSKNLKDDKTILDSHSSQTYLELHRYKEKYIPDPKKFRDEIDSLIASNDIVVNIVNIDNLTPGQLQYILVHLKKAILDGKRTYKINFEKGSNCISEDEITNRRNMVKSSLISYILKKNPSTYKGIDFQEMNIPQLKKIIKDI